jgi:phage internal scaffolding protein
MNMSILIETTIARRDRKLCPKIECGEGLTEQAQKDQCDINLILEDYSRTGFMRHAKQNEGKYDDVSALDFQEAMITVANVKSMFEGLPSEIRKEFGHDPSKFLQYVQDPKNEEELAKRGILRGNDGVD